MQPYASPPRPRRLTNRHLLIYNLYRHGEAVFEGLAPFREWLERPNTALGDKRPVERLVNTAGFREVDDLLTRLEYGVY